MTKPKPFTLRVIDAVISSTLPADIRHMLMVMAYLANNETGCGFTGQRRLADAIGLKRGKDDKGGARELRRKLDRLAAIPDSPVRVERRSRPRSDGHGRSTDEYQLVLVMGTFTSPNLVEPGGRTSPPKAQVAPADQGDVDDTPRGRTSPHPGDVEVRWGSSQGILSVDPRSISVAPKSATRRSAGSSKKRDQQPKAKKRKAERTPEQTAAFTRTKDLYFAKFEERRGEKPVFGKAEGRAVWLLLEKLHYDETKAEKTMMTAFQSFRGGSITILNIASNPQGFEVQLAKASNGRGPIPQPGDGFDFDKYEVVDAQN